MKCIFIGENYSGILGESLRYLGYMPVFVPDNKAVDSRLRGHTDLSVLDAGGDRLIVSCALGDSFTDSLKNKGFQVYEDKTELGSVYPYDCALNICFTGKYYIYNPRSASKHALDILRNLCYEPIEVRQGYSKCSVCVVDEQSIITADAGIARAAEKRGLDVLLITPGHIDLPGFDYGFIGGSAFRLDKHRFALTGVLDGHPDASRIKEYLNSKEYELITLTKKRIFDIGGAIIKN